MVQISRSTLQSSRALAAGERGGDRGESTSYYYGRNAFRRGLFGFFRFLFMSAFIPSVFLIRYYWFSYDITNNTNLQNNHLPSSTFESKVSTTSNTAAAVVDSGNVGNIRSGSTNTGGQQQQQQQAEQYTKDKVAVTSATAATASLEGQRIQMFAFLNEIDFTLSSSTQQQQHRALVESDIVELYHCRIQDMNMNNFTTFAMFTLVNDTVTQLLHLYQKEQPLSMHHENDDNGNDDDDKNNGNSNNVMSWNDMTLVQQNELRISMQQEFVLELLEMYAHHTGYCDFSSQVYHPTVPNNDNNGFTQRAASRLRAVEQQYATTGKKQASGGNKKPLQRRQVLQQDTDNDIESVDADDDERQQRQQQVRLVISIMAFKDVEQLQRLVQAVHMPQHYIIIHVEQRASMQFVQAIQQEILNKIDYVNVVLLQFGTIVYRTDSVSMTNLRIMRWITLDLQLDYDYYITLDGSSFPLQPAPDLQLTLLQNDNDYYNSNDNSNEQKEDEGGLLRFLNQQTDDDASLSADSLQQAQHYVLTTTDTANKNDDDDENDPVTVDNGAAGGGASVWLGSLLHKGVTVDSPQWQLLLQKRLVFTRNNAMLVGRDAAASALSYPKLHKRLPRKVLTKMAAAATSSSAAAAAAPKNVVTVVPSEIIRTHMTKKSISGNQGIFRRNVVQQLLTSSDVMELFALSKYACCCCVEERNWIAALGIISKNSGGGGDNDDDLEQQQQQRRSAINYQQEALRQGSTFELWGGEGKECVSSMKNAVLTMNASICYKIDDQILVQAAMGSATPPIIANTTTSPPSQHYFYGNETWSYLKLAKSKGYFFARKFDSSQPQSMHLLNEIQSELW